MARVKPGSYLMWTFVGVIAQVSSGLQSNSSFITANVGDNVTLHCFYKGDVRLYWYKQTLGQKPKLISYFYKYDPTGVFYHEFKNNNRFTLDNNKAENHLKITDLRVSDSAIYFCAKSYTFIFEFTEGTIVDVKGLGSTVRATVEQAPTQTVQPGGSVTLNCTVHAESCDGQHDVYWFKKSETPDSGLIYAAGRCEKGADARTRTCFYNLPKNGLSQSHTGTYYCAVASCGRILLGKGTRLDFEGDVNSLHSMYFWTAAAALATLLSAVLSLSLCLVNKRPHCPCQDSHANFLASYKKSGDGLYIAAKERKTNRLRKGRDKTWSECVYFGVKQ